MSSKNQSPDALLQNVWGVCFEGLKDSGRCDVRQCRECCTLHDHDPLDWGKLGEWALVCSAPTCAQASADMLAVRPHHVRG